MTEIRIESDAPEDKGKSFAGQKIKIVKRTRRSSSRGSSAKAIKAPPKKPTQIYIVSDSPQDVGRSLGNQVIVSPSQFNLIKKSKTNINVVSRLPSQQQRTQLNTIIRQEQTKQLKQEKDKLLKENLLAFNKILNKKQKEKIFLTMNRSNSEKIRINNELKRIDKLKKNKKINVFEAENLKRDILGIDRVYREPTVTETKKEEKKKKEKSIIAKNIQFTKRRVSQVKDNFKVINNQIKVFKNSKTYKDLQKKLDTFTEKRLETIKKNLNFTNKQLENRLKTIKSNLKLIDKTLITDTFKKNLKLVTDQIKENNKIDENIKFLINRFERAKVVIPKNIELIKNSQFTKDRLETVDKNIKFLINRFERAKVVIPKNIKFVKNSKFTQNRLDTINKNSNFTIKQLNKAELQITKNIKFIKKAKFTKNALRNINKSIKNIERLIKKAKDSEFIKDRKDIFGKNVEFVKTSNISKEASLNVEFLANNPTARAIKEFLPFFNSNSQNAYSKLLGGDKKNITFKEVSNVIFDILTLIPLVGQVVRGGYIAGKLGSVSNLATKLKVTKITGKRRITNIQKSKTLIMLDVGASIIRDVGVSSRAYNAGQEYLQVDNKIIEKALDNLKDLKDEKTGKKFFNSSNDIYQDYITTIHSNNNLLDKKITGSDLTKLLGLDSSSSKNIIKGQKQFLNFLLNNEVNKKLAINIIKQLENKRKARLFGQIVGAIKIEISSEKAAQRLLSAGFSKTTAVGTAGAREGLAFLSSEAFIQDFKITPADLALAVFGGARGSIFFSQQKYTKLTKKQIDNKINLVANKINKKISDSKKNKYVTKIIVKDLKKQGTTENIKLIKSKLTKSDKDKLSLQFIKLSLKQGKLKKKISLKKAKFMLRDPIANIIDPFEIIGDTIFDISQTLKRKLKIGINKKLRVKSRTATTSKTKTKVSSKNKSSSKTKSKVTIKSKSKTKVPSKTKAKVLSKTKTKVPSKTKIKSKTKTKGKSKTKTKSKSKSKTKTKVPTKTKTRTKTKVIVIPILNLLTRKSKLPKGVSVLYEIQYKVGSKFKRLKFKEPEQIATEKAFKLLKSKTKFVQLKVIGTTKKQDIPKPKYIKGIQIKKGLKVITLKK